MAQSGQSTPGQYLPPSMLSSQALPNSVRQRVKSQRSPASSSPYRVAKRYTTHSTHNEVNHHENALAQPLVQMPRSPPPAIVAQPATPAPVIRRPRSLPALRGSQIDPGSSLSKHRSVKSIRNGVRKAAPKVTNRRFDRGDPFNRREKSGIKEVNQASLVETGEEDVQELEMGLSRLNI
ncbi:uncharacterized protein EAF01_000598 [Botrytis porri]|uniref:uncharacterized protein n=1 Tax=Botrytis porri TaxID=87229 RepID=UPI0019029C3E|nr:uncharacterized protein EAF01_000598 [Botrytis porri]KAF7914192.1 hypothetical protein EAF01_000598 [Botrytis porri]